MTEKDVERNIKLYYWYELLIEPLFWGPVLISSLIHLGQMTLYEIYIMEAVVMLGFIVLEIPSGAAADVIGRKKTVILGSFILMLSKVWFSLAGSPLDVWGANITWMIGASLCSGADTALLYDSMKAGKQEHLFNQVFGKAMSNRLLLTAFTALVTGFLASINLRLPLLLSIPGMFIAFTITLFFKEPQRTENYTAKKQLEMVRMSVLFVANHHKVKWVIGYTTILMVASKIWFFSYNPYFELVNLDLRYYGLMFFLLNIVAWFFSRYAYAIVKIASEKIILWSMPLLLGVPILIMGSWVALPTISMILLQNVVRGFGGPFLSNFTNQHLSSENRATVLSIQSAVNGLAQCLGLGIFGLLLHFSNLPFSLQILGFTVLFASIFSIRYYPRIFDRG